MHDPMEHIAELRTSLGRAPDILLAYLFGSYARRQAGPLSDVDIAVLLASQPDEDVCFARRMQIMGQAMDALHVNEVDLLILNQAPLALRYRVIRDGQVILSRDEEARIEFAAQTVVRYLDFQPVVEVFEQAALERARKGELLNGYNPHRGAVERYLRRRQSAERAAAAHV